jgi:hypothetical protein
LPKYLNYSEKDGGRGKFAGFPLLSQAKASFKIGIRKVIGTAETRL